MRLGVSFRYYGSLTGHHFLKAFGVSPYRCVCLHFHECRNNSKHSMLNAYEAFCQ